MLFGNNNFVNPFVLALFNNFTLGTRLQIGVNAGYWIGELAGFERNVVLLRNAQLLGNNGDLIEGLRPIAQVPLNLINSVSEAPKEIEKPKPPKPPKKGKGKAKACCMRYFKHACKITQNLNKYAEKFAHFVQRNIISTEELFNSLFESDPHEHPDKSKDNKTEKNDKSEKKDSKAS